MQEQFVMETGEFTALVIIVGISTYFCVTLHNKPLKAFNGLGSRFIISIFSLSLIISIWLGDELIYIINMANTDFNKSSKIFTIILYFLVFVYSCIDHYADSIDNRHSSIHIKSKIKGILFSFYMIAYGLLLIVYVLNITNFFVIITGWHPIANSIYVVTYTLFSIVLSTIMFLFVYKIILKTFKQHYIRHVLRVTIDPLKHLD